MGDVRFVALLRYKKSVKIRKIFIKCVYIFRKSVYNNSTNKNGGVMVSIACGRVNKHTVEEATTYQRFTTIKCRQKCKLRFSSVNSTLNRASCLLYPSGRVSA